MCVDGDILYSRIWKKLLDKHVFHIFDVHLRLKLVFMHENVKNNQEHMKNV